MVSPNVFLKLNIGFSAIIGFSIIILNSKNLCRLSNNIIGLFFVLFSVYNIIILKQKSQPKLKKDILKINGLLYIFIMLFLLINLRTTSNFKEIITSLVLALFGLCVNYMGFKITKETGV